MKGASKHSLYRTWYGMIDRCNNPSNAAYESYGGRGITVCNITINCFKNRLKVGPPL